MKFNLLILFFIINYISFSSTKSAYDYEITEKRGIIYLKKDSSPFTGKVITKKDRSFYLEGKPHGKWLTFYPNGNLKSIESWKNGKLFGKYILYQENGTKIFETTYLNGKDNGNYFLFHPNGQIQVQGRFKNGIPKGVWKYYNSKGKLIGKAIYPDN